MEQYMVEGKAWRNLLGKLCFIAFGITGLSNPLDRLNLYNIGLGIIIGLFFGFLFKKFLQIFLGLLNGALKKEMGKESLLYAVDTGMLFLIPFAVMVLVSTFYFKWSMTGRFISAGIMAVGTAAALEMGKLKGKQEIKNTIITTGVSFLFTFLWTLSFQFLVRLPGLLEGGINLLRSVLSKGGGAL